MVFASKITSSRTARSGKPAFLACLLLFAVCAGTSAAQTTSTALTANEMAKRVDEHYNHLQTLKAGFSEQYEIGRASCRERV